MIGKHGVRAPLAVAFVVAATGFALLSRVDAGGSYVRDVLPGMLVAGMGLGIAVVSVSMSILTGAREDESGMLSGLNSTGHEIGGTLGIAIFSTIAASATGASVGPAAAAGIGHAFLVATLIATLASLVALLVLPGAGAFLPRLRSSSHAIPMH